MVKGLPIHPCFLATTTKNYQNNDCSKQVFQKSLFHLISIYGFTSTLMFIDVDFTYGES
jgi:hypothetical protein